MPKSYRSGDTRVAGGAGALVFFAALAITSSMTDAYALMTGYPTQVGDVIDMNPPPQPTVIEQLNRFLFWIGPPIALSVAAMWLVLLIRDRLGRDAE